MSSFFLYVFRCVWWVRHRNWCPLLVQTQRLPPLRDGHLHGSAGAPQHGDRVSVFISQSASVSVWRSLTEGRPSAAGEDRQVKGEMLKETDRDWISSGGKCLTVLLFLLSFSWGTRLETAQSWLCMCVCETVVYFCGSPGCCTNETNGFLFSVS